MGFDTMLWLLALISATSAGAFYAGWRAAAAYLPAARAVSEVSNAAVQQANGFAASLDKAEAALTSLQRVIENHTETLSRGDLATEQAIIRLFEGLERAGVARSSSSRAMPRQVGETPSGD